MSALKHLLGTAPPAPIPAEAPPKWREAPLYQADPELVRVLEVAIALRMPLLLTGDPGCGKTSAAYWAAWCMGLAHEQLVHVQVRSDATAESLKYEFDAVRYLRESKDGRVDEDWHHWRRRFVRPGPLWRAFEGAAKRPMVLLLDEIDKAPSDLPNDLLHEFDLMEFEVPDLSDDEGRPFLVSAKGNLPLVVFTSNGERKLPDAFLRRCLHHHLSFDATWLKRIVRHRMEREPKWALSAELVDQAIIRFVQIQGTPGLHHRPGPAELLVWLRILSVAGDIDPVVLESLSPAELPYLGALVKDEEDRKLLARRR